METHSCWCFWKPAVAAQSPPAGATRLRWGWSTFSYPGLPSEVRSLAYTLAELATQESGHWLQQRNVFLLLTPLFLLFGLILALCGNVYGLLGVTMSVFWAMQARMSSNRVVQSLSELEFRLQGKASGLATAFLGAGWRLELGGGMWIRLERTLYEPPS